MNTNVEVNNGDKIIKLKEERGLLRRFVIAARCRPDLDLKDYIGNYEFGVIPRSLFQSDGSLLLPHDKSKVMHGLEGLISECTEVTPTNNGVGRRVILFDGMELVNSIKKSPDIETCFDLANVFIKMLVARIEGFEEVHSVFDRYLEVSLKTKMRSKRTHRTSIIYYHITDSTLIKFISMKELLSDVRTKGELCDYLSEKVLQFSKSNENKLGDFVVTYGIETYGNIEIVENLKRHNHEEADTLLLLHAVSLDPNCEVVLQSPDTDVFGFRQEVIKYEKLM